MAFSTYIIVFNMNGLVHTFSRLYEGKKRKVVRAMHSDPDETWKERGQKFEAFRPKHENPQPSEWYVLIYAILKPSSILGFGQQNSSKDSGLKRDVRSAASSTGLFSMAHRVGRRGHRPQESWREDEGWVIESRTDP